MKKISGKLAMVSGTGSKISSKVLYDEWAVNYDRDLIEKYGYLAPKITVNRFNAFLPNRESSIVDVGCGTGLVGKELANQGFSNIDGYDISPEMLKIALLSKVYKKLKEIDLNKRSKQITNPYDALICVGSFGYGALGPEAIKNLVELVISGGLICLFINSEPFESQNYKQYITKFEKQALWSIKSIEEYNYMSKLDRPGKLLIATKI
ncbi:MAG: methyltransferase domain-containing protein [Rhodobacteraceae bacterium]|nr:methyltransferase domain-containing protein [Paracoccaceae bacterium]